MMRTDPRFHTGAYISDGHTLWRVDAVDRRQLELEHGYCNIDVVDLEDVGTGWVDEHHVSALMQTTLVREAPDEDRYQLEAQYAAAPFRSPMPNYGLVGGLV